MRRAAKVDANQPATVKALRDAGMTVAVTSSLGKGFPDLVVGFRGADVPDRIERRREAAIRAKVDR